ncbi:putative iron-regulated membrane protein [Sphingopyxis panaciterrae]|uniref:PepSY-associated TM helix domain-containing protein n=1 Tax=Sphingopyxis panaciterrae TaxID=363841 RepID=UPI0014212DAE|nr:PepSY-associated TM helix domain-containing protein [Sphingopyxis panaciterrae]NIJ37758.1 putative iron-regulated membrane protein [Sphingopyxis panaciterrae]
MTAPQPRKAAKKPKDLMSRIPAGFVRAVLRGHSSLGLAFAALIYLICLSGSLAVFAHEFQRWESATAPQVTEVAPAAVQTAFEGAIAKGGPGVEHVYITLPTADFPRLLLYVDADEDREFLADGAGRIVPGKDFAWTEFITRLHINLHLPRSWGGFLVGLIGVALLSSLISGILAHPRIFRDAFHLRLGGSKRLQEADLHNRFGVWALPFHIIISLTGAFLGLTTIIVGVLGMAMFNGDVDKVYALFIPAPPVDDPRPAPVLDLRPMYAKLPQDGGRLTYIFTEHPTEMGGAALFNVEQPDRMAGVDSYAFRRDATIYNEGKASDNNLGEDLLGGMGQVHFGWFGGGIVKIVYFLLGLGLTYLAASGVNIWLARRRDKGRPAPGWERAWAATVWGQPAGMAAAAVAGLVTGGAEIAIAAWLAVSLIFLALAIRLSADRVAWLGRLATGVLTLAAAATHLALRGGLTTADPMAWIVNLTLIAGGALLLLRRFGKGRRAAAPVAAVPA